MEEENENIPVTVKLPYKRKSRAKPKKVLLETIDENNDTNHNEEEVVIDIEKTTEYDTFLDELCNETVIEQDIQIDNEPKTSIFSPKIAVETECPSEQVTKKTRKPRTKKTEKQEGREQETEHKNINDMDNEELYADEATPILGKDRLQIIKKIESYKFLFKEELKNFKLAKNPSIDILETALTEIETIIELGTIDCFITDSIIQCIKLTEGASSYTKYDLTGLSALLKENKQFHSLLKMLYIKHHVFTSVPAEYQLLMLVGTTSILCVQKNASKKQLNDRLNEPMVL